MRKETVNADRDRETATAECSNDVHRSDEPEGIPVEHVITETRTALSVS